MLNFSSHELRFCTYDLLQMREVIGHLQGRKPIFATAYFVILNKIHLTRLNLSVLNLRVSPQVHLGLTCFDKTCFLVFCRQKGATLLLQHAAFEIGHIYQNSN